MRRTVAALLALALTPAVVVLRAQPRAMPDPNRWEAAMQKFESQDKEAPPPKGQIKGYCESQPGCEYINVEPEMLGADGRPRPELFVADGKHMTPAGYKIWTRLRRPHLN